MRHRKKGKKLGRKIGPRRALLKGLAINFILSGRIKTTAAKAKAVRPIIEHLISSAKEDNLNIRRQLISFLQNRSAVKKILTEIGPKYKDRIGGYTRIIKMGERKGDAAQMVILELI